MEFLYEYGLFLAKTVTFVVAVIAIVAVATASAIKHKHKKGELEITDLSEQFEEVEQEIIHALLNKEELKEKEKQDKKLAKAQAKEEKALAQKKQGSTSDDDIERQSKVFVIDFKGSIDAKEVNGEWIVYVSGGRIPTERRLFEFAKEMQERGAGEIPKRP